MPIIPLLDRIFDILLNFYENYEIVYVCFKLIIKFYQRPYSTKLFQIYCFRLMVKSNKKHNNSNKKILLKFSLKLLIFINYVTLLKNAKHMQTLILVHFVII